MAKAKHPESSSLSAQLREAMGKSGRTLYELARECGIDSGTLSRFARAERSMTLETADRLAAALRLRLAPGPRR